MADLILYNGKIKTQNLDQPNASALAIRGKRIWQVGNDASIRALAGPGTRLIDLGGRLVLPGFTDSHFHLYDWAHSRQQLQLADTHSLDDVLIRLRERAQDMPPGAWIMGQGWNETRWLEPRQPDRAVLDTAAPRHPVVLWRSDLHLAVANSLALQAAGISARTPDPPEGVIDRDQHGEPTGVLRELAINLVREAIPLPSELETDKSLAGAIPTLHRLGLTGVHDFRLMGGAEGGAAFRAYQRLWAAGELALRVWSLIAGERLPEAIALGLRSGFGDDILRLGHAKYFSDGSQGAHTAWMLEPYLDSPSSGMPLTPMETIAEAIRQADQAGIAVAIHAIGDRANRELIDVFEELDRQRSLGPVAGEMPRHRIEHVQNIRPSDVARLARLGVVASMQPIHTTDDIAVIERSVGDRSRFAYPWRDLLEAGVVLAFGSDAPVADPNPLWGIHAAVTRQRRDGSPPGGWYPDQCLTVAEAVWGYTMAPAVLTGRERSLGSLTPAKLADLVVLDQDIYQVEPAKLHMVKVDLTIFNGRVVFEA